METTAAQVQRLLQTSSFELSSASSTDSTEIDPSVSSLPPLVERAPDGSIVDLYSPTTFLSSHFNSFQIDALQDPMAFNEKYYAPLTYVKPLTRQLTKQETNNLFIRFERYLQDSYDITLKTLMDEMRFKGMTNAVLAQVKRAWMYFFKKNIDYLKQYEIFSNEKVEEGLNLHYKDAVGINPKTYEQLVDQAMRVLSSISRKTKRSQVLTLLNEGTSLVKKRKSGDRDEDSFESEDVQAQTKVLEKKYNKYSFI